MAFGSLLQRIKFPCLLLIFSNFLGNNLISLPMVHLEDVLWKGLGSFLSLRSNYFWGLSLRICNFNKVFPEFSNSSESIFCNYDNFSGRRNFVWDINRNKEDNRLNLLWYNTVLVYWQSNATDCSTKVSQSSIETITWSGSLSFTVLNIFQSLDKELVTSRNFP